MKILKPGREQRGWAKELECTGAGNGGGGCGALLLVEQDDVYRTSHTDYGGFRDVYNTFTCAACGVETDLKHVPFTPRSKRDTDGQLPNQHNHARDGAIWL